MLNSYSRLYNPALGRNTAFYLAVNAVKSLLCTVSEIDLLPLYDRAYRKEYDCLCFFNRNYTSCTVFEIQRVFVETGIPNQFIKSKGPNGHLHRNKIRGMQ